MHRRGEGREEKTMINSLMYLTRRCPRSCRYCTIRNAEDVGPELTVQQWKQAFGILEEIGVDFNLILGNEPWLLGDDLVEIMKASKIPYGLYTTCPEPIFSKYRDRMFQVIDNLSCGVDWPLSYLEGRDLHGDDEKKALDAWRGFQWVKKHHPEIDCQGTVTIHRKNVFLLPSIITELSELGVFVGVNFIHWNKDGGFDFFPTKEALKDMLFEEEDEAGIQKLKEMFDVLSSNPKLLHNPEILREPLRPLLTMSWHCGGNPYGGPTIDSDGTLRVCGYRKGTRTPKFSIFDLPEQVDGWRDAVTKDSLDCPGCAWSCSWTYHYWENKSGEMGKKVFAQHAGEKIPEQIWAKRRNLK